MLETLAEELTEKYGAWEAKYIIKNYYIRVLERDSHSRAPVIFKQAMDMLLAKHLAEVQN